MPVDELDFEDVRDDNDRYYTSLARFRESRLTLLIRSVLSLLALVFGVFLISARWDDVSFLVMTPDQPRQLGDLRSEEFDPQALTALQTNDFVSFENDIILFDEIKSADSFYSFYYSPLTHFVVRTPQHLPAKDDEGVYSISDREMKWVMARRVFPEDLSVSIAGQGRLLRAADAPDWAKGVLEFMSTSSGDPIDSMFVLLEGDSPASYRVYGILFAVAVILVLLTIIFWGNSVRKFLAVKREFESIKKEGMSLNA